MRQNIGIPWFLQLKQHCKKNISINWSKAEKEIN